MTVGESDADGGESDAGGGGPDAGGGGPDTGGGESDAGGGGPDQRAVHSITSSGAPDTSSRGASPPCRGVRMRAGAPIAIARRADPSAGGPDHGVAGMGGCGETMRLALAGADAPVRKPGPDAADLRRVAGGANTMIGDADRAGGDAYPVVHRTGTPIG